MILHYHNIYFFNKHEDWSGEKEYRLVLHSNSERPEFIDFQNALSGIAVGMDFAESGIQKLTRIAD